MAITPNGRVADASPLGKGPRRLSDYEREIAHALMRKGHPKQEAIIIARGLLKKAAASGRWGDHGKAGAATRAGARASIAQRKDFTAEAVADILLAYNAAEPRDSHGRWVGSPASALKKAIHGDVEELEAMVRSDRGPTRFHMPQLSGVPIAGSKADALPHEPGQEVDLTPQFEKELRAAGVSVQETQVKISDLKPTQDQLVMGKVTGLANFMLHAPADSPVWEPIFVSADNHVIDGHHRWAARSVRARINGTPDETMAVRKIGLNIEDALPIATQFMDEWGLPRAGMTNNAVVSSFAHPVGLSNVVAEMLVDLAYDPLEKRDSKGRWTKGVKDVLDTIAQINTAHSLDQMFPDSGVHAVEEGKQRGILTDLLKKDPNLYENEGVRTALKGAGLGRLVTGHDYLKSRTPEQQAKAAADLDALLKQRDKNREKAEAKKALEAVRSELNDLVSDYETSEDFGPEHGIGKQVADLLKAHPEMLKDRKGKALLKYHPELTGIPPSYAEVADENGWADMDASGGSPSQAASMHEEHAAQITSQFWHDTMLDSAPEDERYARSLWEQYQNPDLYGKINQMLRTGKPDEEDFSAPSPERVRRYAQVMFDKAGTTLTKPMTVFRALRSSPQVGDKVAGVKLKEPIVGGHDWAAELAPGTTFKDDGIVSSTAHDNFAQGWLGLTPHGEDKGKEKPNDVVMEIRLKPGQRIVGGSEQFIETMLPPGTTFRIVSSEKRKAKTPRNPLGDYAMDPFDYTHVVAEVVD